MEKFKKLLEKLDIQEISLREAWRLVKVYREFITYAFIGISALVTDVLLFLVFFNTGLFNAVVSNVLAIIVSIIQSFTLNTLFNFKKTDKILLRFISFFTVCMIGMVISTAFLYVLDEYLGVDTNIAKFLSLPVIIIVQFGLNKKITFK